MKHARRKSRRACVRRDRRLKQRKRKWRNQIAASASAPLVFHTRLKREVHVLRCPAHVNLSKDLVETLRFFEELRRTSAVFRRRLTVDLRPIQSITPAGALALAAELDSWRGRLGMDRLNAIDADEWNPTVRARLREMGFFELLNAVCAVEEEVQSKVGDRFLPFINGAGSEGQAAKELRKSIESLGGAIKDRQALYDGLVEAMTNVQHHAYGQVRTNRNWWMSASVDIKSSRLTVLFLDHGVGIPKTLPKSDVWEEVRGYLAKRGLDIFSDDARLIEAAVSVERSRSGEDFRGNGLKNDIQGYIESHDAKGKLRIMSGRGQYVFEKDANGREEVVTSKLARRIQGTFIEWVIEEFGVNDGQD